MENSYKQTEGNMVITITFILFLVALFWFIFGLYARTIGSHVLGVDSLDGVTVYSALSLCICTGVMGLYKDHGSSQGTYYL